jgi:hypothetical protein
MKKGQVMIFVLVGIVLLIGVLLMLNTITSDKQEVTSQGTGTQKFIHNCFETTAECGLHRLGSNSGAIGFTNLIPSLETIEQTAATYVDQVVHLCFSNFTQVPGQDVSIHSINPEVSFNEKSLVKTEPVITIQEGLLETRAQRYNQVFDIPFRNIYNTAVQLKSGAKPEGVSDSYIKLEADFDVSVADKAGKKFVSIAGGSLKKKDFRFNFVK